MKPMRVRPRFFFDIFFCCSMQDAMDDFGSLGDGSSWITTFRKELTEEVGKCLGRPPQTYLEDIGYAGSDKYFEFDQGSDTAFSHDNALVNSAIMIAIVTENFHSAPRCLRDLAAFYRTAGSGRIITILTGPTTESFPVPNVAEFGLFSEDDNGRIRKFYWPSWGAELDSFRHLASQISLLLEDLTPPTVLAGTALQVSFDFPAPIKNACEQYLMYFSQFLQDLGINATTKLDESANSVLFSVIPEDGNEALERVQEALKIYLGVPTAPNFASEAAKHTDVAVVQLQANVLHLQSQVTMAKAVFQAQVATIEAKDQTILALQERLDLRALQPTASPKKETEDKEELVKDLVAIKKFDYKFVELNLPEVLRRIKRAFGKP